jgi:diguanylate cyclase (GGDEF)-like protein/PAS domain S-box-containing protein
MTPMSNPAHSTDTLRLAIDAADVGVWFWDLASDEHQWSDRCKTHLALPAGAKPTTESFYAAMHPDDRDRVREVIRRSHETGEDYRAEYRIRQPDGSERWIAAMGRSYAGPDGSPASMRGVTLDITRLKRAEQEVRELNTTLEARVERRTIELSAERRRLVATLDSLIDPHLLMQPARDDAGHVTDFIVAYANPAACTWIGVDAERARGARLLDLQPEIQKTGLLALLVDTANTGRTTAIDAFAFPREASGVHWIDLRAARVDGQVSFTWLDVTKQHEATARLAASEERFRLLAENSSDVVLRTDRDLGILWVSPSVTPVLGWSPADWIGRTVTEVLGSGTECGRFLNDHDGALSGRSVVVRTRMPAKDGGVHWVEIHAGPSRTAGGSIDGVVASFRLVDKEMEAERILELRARTDELTALLNRKEAIERIDRLTLRTGCRIAVLSCDIDRFKAINDTYGHAAGDSVLQAVADRIRGCLRSDDDLGARIGGDELLVILHGVRDLDDALTVAEKLRSRAAEPIHTAVGPVTATVSIGVTLARPSESTDAVIVRADKAMYAAKNSGRNRVVSL